MNKQTQAWVRAYHVATACHATPHRLSCIRLRMAEATTLLADILYAVRMPHAAADFNKEVAGSSNLGFTLCQLCLHTVKVGRTGSA